MENKEYFVKDFSLKEKGRKNVALARERMPALEEIRKRFEKEKPFSSLRIGMALHVTKETAVLIETLLSGGAEVAIASCNPLSTQDDVAAYLASIGVNVFAYKGETKEHYYEFIERVISYSPVLTVDDGGDLVTAIHERHEELIENIIGGTEETTTGVIRLRNMEKQGKLKYPVIAVNDNKTKHMFDNYYGTGQSTWDGIMRAINPLVAGKTVVVAGYGDCGKGVAIRAKGLGANVVITEVDEIKALQALHDGYKVMPMDKAAEIGDIFITVTGNKDVITYQHVKKMKKGAILANSGHFDVEIAVKELKEKAKRIEKVRDFVEKLYFENTFVYLLAEGRLVNLSAAEGHPSEVMDLSFAGQALALEYLVKHKGELENKVYTLPEELDKEIARLKLKGLGVSYDKLTEEQKRYLESWKEGT